VKCEFVLFPLDVGDAFSLIPCEGIGLVPCESSEVGGRAFPTTGSIRGLWGGFLASE